MIATESFLTCLTRSLSMTSILTMRVHFLSADPKKSCRNLSASHFSRGRTYSANHFSVSFRILNMVQFNWLHFYRLDVNIPPIKYHDDYTRHRY